MKKKHLEKIIAGASGFTIGALIPYIPIEVKPNTHIQLKEEIVFQSNQDRYERLVEKGKRIAAERKAEEETRIKAEEERLRTEQETLRIAEINRKNSVSVELDNVLIPSNITVDELINVFDYYDYSRTMIELAPIIIEAEKTYGINAFIISAIISWESAYNTSHRAVYDNNVLGWGVYSESATGINASSKYENIMNACSFLSSAYLSPEGIYFNGYSTWSINQNYCLDKNGIPDDEWSIGINSIAKNYEWVYKNVVRKV